MGDGNMQYVRWSGGGPWLGKAFLTQPLCQGPFWWIKRVHFGGGSIGVFRFDVSWQTTHDIHYSDDPILSGLPGVLIPQHILTEMRYPPLTGAPIISSAPPVITDETTLTTQPAHIAIQETLFYQPEHTTSFNFSGVFTLSTVDGLAITGGPFASTGEAAAEYFANQIDRGGGVFGFGPGGGVFTWSDLQSFGDIAGNIPDPDRIESSETVTITTITYTAHVLAFIDLGLATAAELPGSDHFSFEVPTVGSETNVSYSWAMSLATFRGHALAEFTHDAHNAPTWTFTPISQASLSSGTGGEGHTFPANTSTFTVNTAADPTTLLPAFTVSAAKT